MDRKPLLNFFGYTRIGFSYILSIRSLGFGNVEFFKDHLIVYPFKKVIHYSNIEGVYWPILGGFSIDYKEGYSSSYISYWFPGKNSSELNKLKQFLKKKNVKNIQ